MSNRTSVLARVMNILTVFRSAKRPMSISEIARRTNLPVSTAHRLISEMIDYNILARDNFGKISIGTRLWEISHQGSFDLKLRNVAMPWMESLQSAIGQHTQLAIFQEHEVLYIERLSHRDAVKNVAHIATRLPPHVCSPGQVFLAFGPRAWRDHGLSRPLEALTPATITDPTSLRRTLGFIKRFGYAVAVDSTVVGSKGVAVPIWGQGQELIASLSIVLPSNEDHLRVIPALKASSVAISDAMGAQVINSEDYTRQQMPYPQDPLEDE